MGKYLSIVSIFPEQLNRQYSAIKDGILHGDDTVMFLNKTYY